MPLRTALILQGPSIHRAMTALSLRELGYDQVLEVSEDSLALKHICEAGGITLLVCDFRAASAARIEVVQSSARELQVQKILMIGEPFPGAWPTLSKVLSLHGVICRHLSDRSVTQKLLMETIRGFDSTDVIGLANPVVAELPPASEVISALANDEIRAALQPKVSLDTGSIYGFEVLARWQHADGSVISPNKFLPALREHGFLDVLLFKLLEQSIKSLQNNRCDHLELSLNLEPSQIARPGFGARLYQQLVHLGISPKQITFELTENGLIEVPVISLDNLLYLRTLGCGLAIDDFGNGHSTLQRLLGLPFTELKLDSSFLSALDDPRRHAILENAIALGDALNIPVVAEGVETEDQLQLLRKFRCARAQGFYLGRPLMEREIYPLSKVLACESRKQRFA